MSGTFLYESKVSQYRPSATAQAGLGSYDVLTDGPAIAINLPASVQIRAYGSMPEAKLPGDIPQGGYKIIFPFSAFPVRGALREGDVLIDDLGRRFRVVVYEWTFLGSTAFAQLQEV